MGELLTALFVYFVSPALSLLVILVILGVVLSWLVQFDVIPPRHPFALGLMRVHDAVLGPILRPIRRAIPPLGGVLDVGPLVLILGVSFLQGYALPALIRLVP